MIELGLVALMAFLGKDGRRSRPDIPRLRQPLGSIAEHISNRPPKVPGLSVRPTQGAYIPSTPVASYGGSGSISTSISNGGASSNWRDIIQRRI